MRPGKVGRTEAIPSSLALTPREWSRIEPSQHAGSSNWNAAHNGPPPSQSSDEIHFVSQSQNGGDDGTLGNIRSRAYRNFQATLEDDKYREAHKRIFGGNPEVHNRMFGNNDSTPKAERSGYESPDPLALNPGDFEYDGNTVVTPTKPVGTKKVKALATVSTLKANQPFMGTGHDRRSPSPLPPPPSKGNAVPRRERRQASPHESPLKKARTSKASASESSRSKLGKAVPKGKCKPLSSKKVDRFPTPSPIDLLCSQESLDPNTWFDNLQAADDKKWDELKYNALNPTANPCRVESSADEDEFKQLEERDLEEYKRMRRLRKKQTQKQSYADSFFENAPQMAEETRRRRSLEARSIALAETVQFAPKEREVGEDELYCAHFKNHRNLCLYCSEPLPVSPSAELRALQLRYASITNLSFRQTVTLCTMHRAETTIIPLGLRDGFPKDIDFEDVDRRLESGWIAVRLKKVAANPKLSKFYRRAKKEINQMGIAAWKDVAHQSNDTVLSHAQPGYYGDLGRAIMIRHFQNLILWRYLKLGSDTAPLPETDFIVTVLVPEAAVLLTMEDKGWDISLPPKGEEWDKARAEAMEICRRAGRYGYWKFREDGDKGRLMLERIDQAASKKRRRLEATRQAVSAEIDRKIQAEKVQVVKDAILVASSDTEQPDDSDWGDEVWEDADAVAQAAAAVDRRAAVQRQDSDATPQPKRRPLSPRKLESTPRPMKSGRLLKKASQISQASSAGYDEGWDDQFVLSIDV
ncbi:hypothetical protein CcaverHIS002_0303370 [Cutaneotrichosporon cavernicola]|nr:hypothetical protein CcaverHIS002_0303370 [Cutaneotrichosporon cavernicola]BEI98043.1 hypothetical protein CcaverHIS631_0303420 [Cutaneotrichosporon cavernicola]BEJ05820.1 hypothetical protein CcaverHIS641_0303420 [Cutaneotrichosporon cavernicola]